MKLSEKTSTENQEKGPNSHSFLYNAAKIAAGLVVPVVMLGSFGGCQEIKSFFNGSGSSITDASGNLLKTTRYETTIRPHTTRPPITTTVAETTGSEIEQKLAMAPNIEGAVKVVRNIGGYDRVTYERNGEYIGEFKKEVLVDGKETGGVALVPNEAKKMLNADLSKGAPYEYFIPADISELKKANTPIEISKMNFNDSTDDAYLKISFGGENVSISNPIINGSEIGITNTLEITLSSDKLFGIAKYGMPVAGEKTKQENIVVIGNFKFKETVYGEPIPFGQKMTETNGDSIVVFMNSYTAPNTIPDNQILEVDKAPVFVVDK